MTLAVSLRVPDGLVIASDSLSTTAGHIGIAAEFEGQCPKCRKEIKIKNVSMPSIQIPTSLSSFAQKVFPFKKVFGIATFGMAILNEKTIYYHVKKLEKNTNETFLGAIEVANFIMEYFNGEIKKQIKDIDKAPDDFYPLGFLVAGYDEDIAKTIVVSIGKKSKIKENIGSGCTYGGDGEVVNVLWQLSKSDPRRATIYATFSLQDAVDYAEYLIYSTANFQRFSNMIPTVGGHVDIGLITPFKEFTWIKCKEMTKILEMEQPLNIGGLCNEKSTI
ncbi:MAG: hypothetical protein PHU44_12015 [Syntrophales bacterium]|nr:hypothetical protein [Syntrophales bacterium]MDD5641547.1 hypothetical protein [Syntrophales bacterium]